jgi:glutaredoxin
MPQVTLFVSRWCVQCERAAALLERHGIAYEAVDVGAPDGCCRLKELTGGSSVPQALVDGTPIGGYDAIAAFVTARSAAPPMPDPDASTIVLG